MQQNKLVLISLLVVFVVGIGVIYFFDGTGDVGDSVSHFLYSRFAFDHPRLLLHHWAKPVFVLFTAPFAQFGFEGMKLFNWSVILLAVWLSYRSAQHFSLSQPWLVLPFFLFIPYVMRLGFSGLTEPLFACWLIGGLLLLWKEKQVPGLILLSFLPFVRSEGLIVLGVLGVYLLLRRFWRLLPFLLIGHFVYSVVGAVYYGNMFWVFKKIPYASMAAYGSGPWHHFIEALFYVVGAPIYLFVCFGLLGHLRKIIVEWKSRWSFLEQTLLVYGIFVAYVAAHSVFYFFGIFNSMGLSRVLIGVAPLIALIAVDGYHFLRQLPGLILGEKAFAKYLGTGLGSILLVYTFIFPFVPSPGALKLPHDFTLTPDQQLAEELADFVGEQYPEHRYFYTHPYLSIALGADPFIATGTNHLEKGLSNPAAENTLYIWDDWFAPTDQRIQLADLRARKDLTEVKAWEKIEANRHYQLVLFRKASPSPVE